MLSFWAQCGSNLTTNTTLMTQLEKANEWNFKHSNRVDAEQTTEDKKIVKLQVRTVGYAMLNSAGKACVACEIIGFPDCGKPLIPLDELKPIKKRN